MFDYITVDGKRIRIKSFSIRGERIIFDGLTIDGEYAKVTIVAPHKEVEKIRPRVHGEFDLKTLFYGLSQPTSCVERVWDHRKGKDLILTREGHFREVRVKRTKFDTKKITRIRERYKWSWK